MKDQNSKQLVTTIYNETALLMLAPEERAIHHANQYLEYREKTIVAAIRTGLDLIEIKTKLDGAISARGVKGDFKPWIEANMPIKYIQCTQFIKLAEEYAPVVRLNEQLESSLDIDSEVMLLAFNIEDRELIRESARGTQKEAKEKIREFKDDPAKVDELKKALEDKESWRIQCLREKDLREQVEIEKANILLNDGPSKDAHKIKALNDELRTVHAEKAKLVKETSLKIKEAEDKAWQRGKDSAQAEIEKVKKQAIEEMNAHVQKSGSIFLKQMEEISSLKAQINRGGKPEEMKNLKAQLVRKENELQAAQRAQPVEDPKQVEIKALEAVLRYHQEQITIISNKIAQLRK